MRLDPEILDRPPDEGARVVALALCTAAEDAARRAAEGGDGEALHDFRVALRRLRSTLRAWEPTLVGALPARTRRGLRRLSRATGPARDAEVMHDWLAGLGDLLPEPARPALEWLASRVGAARRGGREQVGREVAPAFLERAPGLAQGLAVGGAPPAPEAETFGGALALLARRQLQALREALAEVQVAADVGPAHRARIEAKRLRYLVEPLRGAERADSAAAVRPLKELQDLLGEMNDAHRAEAEVRAALVVAAAERASRRDAAGQGQAGPDLRPGLLLIERLARERSAGLFARLEGDWLGKGLTAALDRVFEVIAALELRDADQGDPERRLLLSDLPPEGRGAGPEETEEQLLGYLPGGREGVGLTRGPAGERCHRSSLQGRGGRRFEVVEEIGREAHDAYWPLTDGRRLHRRRHRPAATPGWWFDEYLDRRLVLAISPGGDRTPPPQWLEPVFVRDVSAERGYADEALARKGGAG